jgi:hypothetical protein
MNANKTDLYRKSVNDEKNGVFGKGEWVVTEERVENFRWFWNVARCGRIIAPNNPF